MDASRPESRVRFGPFEVNVQSGELRRHGHRIRIQPQPMKVLAVLLERPGELVTRDELRKRLWPGELHVDFELGLNRSINKLRRALLDDANSPRYIETLSGRGYRFVAAVESRSSSVDFTRAGPATAMAEKSAGPEEAGAEAIQPMTQEALDSAASSAPIAKGSPPEVWWSVLAANFSWRRGLILTAGVLIVVVPLILASAWRPRHTSAAPLMMSERLKPVPLVTFANGSQWLPAFSPDGSRIAYSLMTATGWYLEVKEVGSDTRLRLTQRPSDFPPGPAWSPDGRQIAFARAGLSDDRGVFIISAMGGPERKLCALPPSHVPQRVASWSPDGGWIAIADEARLDSDARPARHGQNAIYLISPETSERRQLTQPPHDDYGDNAPAFSPDGATIAFVRTKVNSHDEIYTIPVEGGPPHQLVTKGLWTNGLTWTADGQSIVFDRSQAGGFGLWRVSATGSDAQPLDIPCEFTCLEPTLWRDRLAYEAHEQMRTVGRLALNGSYSESPTTPVASTRVEHGARYSPDGSHIAFISNRTGADELWLTDSEGANPVELTHLKTPLVDLSWDTTGDSIAVSAYSGKVYMVSVETQASRLLFDGLPFTDENARTISFSGNGDFFYVLSEPGTGESYDLLKVPVAGGAPTKVVSGRLTNFAESMDGKTLFYSRTDGLWKRPVEGGPEEYVAPSSGIWDLRADGLYILTNSSSIERYSLKGKRLQTVAKLGQFWVVAPMSISTDGRWAIFGYQQRQTVEIDMVQGFN